MQEALTFHGRIVRASILARMSGRLRQWTQHAWRASITMTNWIPVREALPEEGAPVQFSFNERALVLRGVFRYGAFASRWSRYLPTEISAWRRLEAGESLAEGENPHRFLFDVDDH